MPNRSKAPGIQAINHLQLPVAEKYTLQNGIPVYGINLGAQDVLKVEVVFFAGRPYEHKPIVSRATVGLLKEGSRKNNAALIAERLDFYGSSLSFPFYLDTANIVLYSLNKYVEKVIPILAEVLGDPVFPEAELENFIARNKQRLLVDLQKNDVVAYREITEQLFGKEHPYGYNSLPETYEGLLREDLIRHYKQYYNSNNCFILLSGRFDQHVLKTLDRHLGQALKPGRRAEVSFEVQGRPARKLHIDQADSVQSAIRVGRRMFNRHHPDYHGMYVLNTILGGYFGSRLMANIREEKGYTYNVFSMLDTMIRDGFFYIGTEVGNGLVEDTLREIYREMEKLQEELIDKEELEMVRNYLLGNFLTTLDGPFNISEWIKHDLMDGLPTGFFEEAVRTVRHIEAEELRRLAQMYFQKKDMWEVVVGQMEG